jgi:predicted metal-dependent peptidase
MMKALPIAISRARIQLMLRHNYLASATARLKFRIIDEPWCRTMATDGFNIFVNEAFASSLTEDEVIGVIAHEVMHCVLGHIDRRGNRRPDVWNIAIDYATNLMLSNAGVTLPKIGLLDQDYKGMTAEDIYTRITDLPKEKLDELLAGVGLLAEASSGSEDGSDGTPGAFRDVHLDLGDLHGQWARVEDFPTEAERHRLRRAWQSELKSKMPGTASGSFASEIDRAGRQEINWREFFSRFVTGLRRDDYRMYPANKKHIWRQVYLPSFGSPGPDHIIITVDTSGSMDASILGKIITEIDSARQMCGCKLTILQCDTHIKHAESFDPWELLNREFKTMRMHGRGGTSFSAPFEWVEQYVRSGHPQPDAMIYMTDGFGSFPKAYPLYPCLWIVPESGSDKFPFGDVIRVSTEP